MKRSLWFRITVAALIVAGIVCVYVVKNHVKLDSTNEVLEVENDEIDAPLYDGIDDVVPAIDAEDDENAPAQDVEDTEIVLPMFEEIDDVVFALNEKDLGAQSLIKECKWVECAAIQDVNSPKKDLSGADFRLRATQPIDFDALAAYGLPVVVDYCADACLQCKRMAPVLEQANKKYRGKAFIKFVNVWDYPKAAKNAPIQLIPTQVFFDSDGRPFAPSSKLAAEIEFQKRVGKDSRKRVFTIHQGELTKEQLEKILVERGATKND